VESPTAPDPWDAPPVPAERRSGPRSSLFSAPAPPRPPDDDDDIAELLTVVVGGRLVERGDEESAAAPALAAPSPPAAAPSPDGEVPPGPAGGPPFGPVLVSRLSGEDAYLVDPTGATSALPVLTAPGSPTPSTTDATGGPEGTGGRPPGDDG